MKKLIITLIVTISALACLKAIAFTDYACMNDCTSRGYSYQLCKHQCSYDD